MAEQLAIIRDPRLGASDRGTVALSFQTFVSEGSAALQVLWMERDDGLEKAVELLRTVDDVSRLDGKPCWVESDGMMIKYLRPAKIG